MDFHALVLDKSVFAGIPALIGPPRRHQQPHGFRGQNIAAARCNLLRAGRDFH